MVKLFYAPNSGGSSGGGSGFSLDPISAGITAATDIAEITAGLIGAGKAKKEAAFLKKTRPKATLSPEIQQNLSLAESELSKGISSEAERAWREDTDTALASSIGAIEKSGGTPNDVSQVFANTAEGRRRMLQYQEQLRQQQIANLSSALGESAADRKAVFDYNSREWFDEAQANAAARQRFSNMIWGGVGNIGGAALNEATLAQQQKLYGKQNQSFMQQMESYFNPQTITGTNTESFAPVSPVDYTSMRVSPDAVTRTSGSLDIGRASNNYLEDFNIPME